MDTRACITPHVCVSPQGIGKLFEKIQQENKANGHPHGDGGLFFTNLYVTPVLKNISLYLEKGKMLAVAGSTGSGKVGRRTESPPPRRCPTAEVCVSSRARCS